MILQCDITTELHKKVKMDVPLMIHYFVFMIIVKNILNEDDREKRKIDFDKDSTTL